eukprot:PRCOL_00006104-RA
MLLSYHGFKFPITLTMIHMACCALLSYATIVGMQVVPLQRISSADHLRRVATLAAVFTLSVMAGNTSLKYIPVSFNQAIGATTPAWTAGIAYAFAGTTEKRSTYLALAPVILGVVLATGAEPSFRFVGLVAALTATVMRGIKSVLQGILLTNPAETLTSQNLLLYMAPISLVMMAPFALYIEGRALLEYDGLTPSMMAMLLLNGCAAYLVNLSNFLVTKYTSALTLQVLGNAKGAFAVFVSVLIFQNPVTAGSVGGYGVTLAGCALYTELKRRDRLEAVNALPTTVSKEALP